MSFKSYITIGEEEIDVMIDITSYESGCPGVHTFPTGDPGYPGEDPGIEFDVYDLEGNEIPEISDEDNERLIEEAFEAQQTEDEALVEARAIEAHEDHMRRING